MNSWPKRATIGLPAALLTLSLTNGLLAGELDSVHAKLRSGKEVRLAAIGDSITYLCGHTDARRNYLTFVAEALGKTYPAATISVRLSGNRGNSKLGLGFLDELLDSGPDVVFVMFGMNDCGVGARGLPEYNRNLSEFVRRIRARGAAPVILTQNQIVYHSKDGAGRVPLADYMRRAVEIAQRENATVVDNFADWTRLQSDDPSWRLYLNDAIHPNLAGHRLFARRILEQLWPEAAGAHYAGLRPPLSPEMQRPTDALLNGPAAAQILRAGSRWLILTARRRNGINSDLVLSVCENNPWKSCSHHTLVGPESDALFPWGETDLNGAMILADAGHIYIVFSQTFRVSLLTVDTSKTSWIDRLGQRSTYSAMVTPELPLPQTLRGCHQSSCEIVDGLIDDSGYPAFLIRGYIHGEGSGIGWLSWSAAEREYVSSLTWPAGPNPARGRIAVDFVVNSGIKPDDRPWRYEGRPPSDAGDVGLLWEDQGIHFQVIPIKPK
jgi:lysophospholipase L1-like esterase